MRRKFEIKAGEKYPFVIGQSDNYLIMRNLTDNIMLESDSFKNVELSRSDTVVISDYQNIELRLFNTSNSVIVGEIQLSEVDIRIKEQRMGIEGGVVIDEIITPVVVSEVQKPIVVEDIRQAIRIEETYPAARYRDVHESTTLEKGAYSYVMLQAHADNVGPIKMFGIAVPPGGYYEITRRWQGSLSIDIMIDGDSCTVMYINLNYF